MTSCIKTGAWVWIEFEQACMPADIYELHPYKVIRFPYNYQNSAFRGDNTTLRKPTHILSDPLQSMNFFSADGQNIIVESKYLKKVNPDD